MRTKPLLGRKAWSGPVRNAVASELSRDPGQFYMVLYAESYQTVVLLIIEM